MDVLKAIRELATRSMTSKIARFNPLLFGIKACQDKVCVLDVLVTCCDLRSLAIKTHPLLSFKRLSLLPKPTKPSPGRLFATTKGRGAKRKTRWNRRTAHRVSFNQQQRRIGFVKDLRGWLGF